MQKLLTRFADVRLDDDAPTADDPIKLFAQLIDTIRPRSASNIDAARSKLQELCRLLDAQPTFARGVRETLIAISSRHRHSEIYTSTGILPNTGFFSEIFRRIGHKILPEALDLDLLRTAVRRVFRKADDGLWVIGVGEETWLQLLASLRFKEQPSAPEMPKPIAEMLRSLRVLSYWIAAAGMEPELLKLDRALETYESPFVTQNEELLAYIDAYPHAWRNPETLLVDDKHLLVLLDQCIAVIERMRKRAAREGTSIRLTYHLQRLHQLILRCEQVLEILDHLMHNPDGETAMPPIVRLFSRLISEECQRDNLGVHWQRNTELMALRVTDNAGYDGEHFITETRGEYFQLARGAAIGGFVIALMACLKLLFGKAHMAPLVEATVFCLNYGIGFCIIHILHGTVATKQPAMMANTIAGTISQSGGRLRDIEALTGLIARTIRSQIVAILGNIVVAVPVAAAAAYAFAYVSGIPLADADKSAYLLGEQSLIHSASVFYGAICGICLFLAGLISGYFDNYAVYNHIPQRILQLKLPRRLFGTARMRRVADYIHDNLGALAGNLLFGFMLGGFTVFGDLFGLPIDTRHVAFSSAFIGISFVGSNFLPEPNLLLWAALGVAAIGFFNLTVSFALALKVALRARQVTETPWRKILWATLRHLAKHPRDFFLPPKRGAKADEPSV